MPNSSGLPGPLSGGLSMPMHLIGFGAFTPGTSLLDGSESDGTNVFTGTDAMTSGWTADQATFTNATTLAPNGGTVASSLIENAATNRHMIYQLVSGRTANSAVRFSIYAKQSTRRYLQLCAGADNGTAGSAWLYADLQTGTVTDTGVSGGSQSVTNTSISAAVNGFYKVSGDLLLSATTTQSYFSFALSTVSTHGGGTLQPGTQNQQYAGDGASLVFLWRPKLVQL